MNKVSKLLLSLTGIALLLVIGIYYWHYSTTHPSTDNAYLNANRIEVNANISGQVQKLAVTNNQLVKKGQLLFVLDQKPLLIALSKAQANLQLTKLGLQGAQDAVDSAKANVNQAQAQYDLDKKNAVRIAALVKDGKASLSEGDKAKAKLAVSQAALAGAQSQYKQALTALGAPGDANAKLRQAKAMLAEAKLNLHYSKITAPSAGKISNLSLQIGDMAQQGRAVFTLINQDNWWVDANFKETQLKRIKVGQTAEVVLDMYPDKTLKGVVASISGGTGSSFSILPPENAAGNWVKVTQRVPIKIKLEATALTAPIGASATVTIDTTTK